MNLVIDAGNTGLKAALFENGVMLKQWAIDRMEVGKLISDLTETQLDATLIAAVAPVPEILSRFISDKATVYTLGVDSALPIQNAYATPATLGADRLANAVAANSFYPAKNVLVVDAGTCLKFDFVNQSGVYLGGAISPGMMMRFKALHAFTDRLPLLDPVESVSLIGNDTKSSIQTGVMIGMKAEIESVIEYYNREFTDLKCILTGGDHRFFLNQPKNDIFAVPYLTLTGLDVILRYNQ